MVYCECSKCKREVWLERAQVDALPLDLIMCLPCLRPDLFKWSDTGDLGPQPDAPYKGSGGPHVRG